MGTRYDLWCAEGKGTKRRVRGTSTRAHARLNTQLIRGAPPRAWRPPHSAAPRCPIAAESAAQLLTRVHAPVCAVADPRDGSAASVLRLRQRSGPKGAPSCAGNRRVHVRILEVSHTHPR